MDMSEEEFKHFIYKENALRKNLENKHIDELKDIITNSQFKIHNKSLILKSNEFIPCFGHMEYNIADINSVSNGILLYIKNSDEYESWEEFKLDKIINDIKYLLEYHEYLAPDKNIMIGSFMESGKGYKMNILNASDEFILENTNYPIFPYNGSFIDIRYYTQQLQELSFEEFQSILIRHINKKTNNEINKKIFIDYCKKIDINNILKKVVNNIAETINQQVDNYEHNNSLYFGSNQRKNDYLDYIKLQCILIHIIEKYIENQLPFKDFYKIYEKCSRLNNVQFLKYNKCSNIENTYKSFKPINIYDIKYDFDINAEKLYIHDSEYFGYVYINNNIPCIYQPKDNILNCTAQHEHDYDKHKTKIIKLIYSEYYQIE